MHRLLLLSLLVLPLGCGFSHINRDNASRPERAMGTGARIMLPSDSAPPLSGYNPYDQDQDEEQSGASNSSGNSSGPQAAAPGSYGGGGTQSSSSGPGGSSGSSSGSPPEGPEMTMIGGTSAETDREERIRDVPLGPLAVLFGYPFWIFGKSVSEEADQAAEERTMPDPKPDLPERSSHPQDVAQRSRMQRENAELAEQLRQQAPPVAHSAGDSIHDELAALERSLGRGTPQPGVTPRQTADRDADGRADLWSKTAPDGTSREALDENHDGRVDRVLSYDEDHRLVRSEEDRDGDGRFETVSQFESGELHRRQTDDNGDGKTDSWTFFSGGEMVRHEVDRDADGMKDLSMIYSAGELIREEEDRNGDGRPDLISHYRNGEVVERAEDTDYDGRTDLRSFYEHGRLVRREVS